MNITQASLDLEQERARSLQQEVGETSGTVNKNASQRELRIHQSKSSMLLSVPNLLYRVPARNSDI